MDMIQSDSGGLEWEKRDWQAEERLDFENCGRNGNHTGEKSLWKIWPNLINVEGTAS